MKYIPIIFISILLNGAQSNNSIPPSPESKQFNFWIGKWDLFTNGTRFGESKADTILDGLVIQEYFTEFPPDPFSAINWTSFDNDIKKWKQTMVDNQGHHLEFIGGHVDDKIILLRNFKNKNEEKSIQRITFYNISKNSFDWTFDASDDDGKSWHIYYNVHYVRKS